MPGRIGTLREAPPEAYWESLANFPPKQIENLRQLFSQRASAIPAHAVAKPSEEALPLLSRVVADGWLEDDPRHFCPNPACSAPIGDPVLTVCPECGDAFVDHGEMRLERWFTRDPLPERKVAWVVALHGMNTSGVWQEQFNWLLGTTWGRSVPVAIYKYGNIKTGVILPFRRRQLIQGLRQKLIALQNEATRQEIEGLPDAVAHSFGTWLLGHVLAEEVKRGSDAQVKFGRIILTGSILRPDFDWSAVRDAGLIEEVLDHYGTKDSVVSFAEFTIGDSGPSGRRGFDDAAVLNVPAPGYLHGTFFSMADDPKQVDSDGKPVSVLRATYETIWKPYLKLPAVELRKALGADPVQTRSWRAMPWALNASVLPTAILLAAAATFAALVFGLGWAVAEMPHSWLQLALRASGIAFVVAAAVSLLVLAVGWSLRKAWR